MDLAVVATTFVAIFLVELPDKTFIAALVLSTRYRPLAVWLGVGLAFGVQTVVAVTVGFLATLLPDVLVKSVALVIFLIGAVVLFGTAPGADDAEKKQEQEYAAGSTQERSFAAAAVASLLVLFAAEWGDLSQLLTISLVGRYQDRVGVFVGAWSALLVVSALAVVAGRVLLRYLRTSLLHYLGAGVCLLLAALTLVEIIGGAVVRTGCPASYVGTTLRPMTNQGAARHGADSEVGRLRSVMLHRPGPELTRLTPRNNDKLLFDGIPWVGRAQEEHDGFAQALRDRDVEVLYLTDLLTQTLHSEPAREHAVAGAMASLHLGDTLRAYLREALRDHSPQELSLFLTAGVRNDEIRGGHGLVTSLLAHDDFLIDPLPNLLFTRDSSVWVRDRVAVTSLAMPARERETQLTELIYTHHPRFAGTRTIHGWQREHVEGGDVLLLAPGVIAVGVGERTTPAGAERLARQVFGADLAHTVLAVPIAQERATMHLDTVCTMVDIDKIVMYPNVADSLTAHAVTVADRNGDDDADLVLRVAAAEPFLVAAAKAMSIDSLHQIDTGLDPVTAEREQWDDGNNTLAVSPRVAVAYERNVETNSRLAAAGIEVMAISGSELGSGRGGPRCMSCPVSREPLVV